MPKNSTTRLLSSSFLLPRVVFAPNRADLRPPDNKLTTHANYQSYRDPFGGLKSGRPGFRADPYSQKISPMTFRPFTAFSPRSSPSLHFDMASTLIFDQLSLFCLSSNFFSFGGSSISSTTFLFSSSFSSSSPSSSSSSDDP